MPRVGDMGVLFGRITKTIHVASCLHGLAVVGVLPSASPVSWAIDMTRGGICKYRMAEFIRHSISRLRTMATNV